MNQAERIPELVDEPQTVLRDLLSTRETANRAPRSPGRAPAWRAWKLFPAPAEQRSLFGEILDWMLAPLLLVWPLSIGLTFVIARSLADAPFDRALIDHANVLAQHIQFHGQLAMLPSPGAVRELLPATAEGEVIFQIADGDGALLAGAPDLPPPAIYDFPEPGVVKLRHETYRGDEVRVAYLYVTPRPSPSTADAIPLGTSVELGSSGGVDPVEAPPVLVQVAETQERRNVLANEIIKGVIFPQFLILPIAVGLVWFGMSRGLAPLKQLQTRIRERRPDDLSPIDPRDAPQEIAPLVDAFNDLLTRLAISVAAQKRFIADAAHQIKTPLAGLRMQADMALRERDPALMRGSLEQLAVSSDRAAHLVSQLLALARTENLRDAGPRAPVDMQSLARATASDWVAEALRRGVDFGFESDERPATIAGNALLLREMFNNLIDNALRYTPQGGTVTARLSSNADTVVFAVEDTGPGIPESERELVFERFYRVLGTQTDGSGLGLAIVREIAEQHHATVRIDDAGGPPPHPGTRVSVQFAALHPL